MRVLCVHQEKKQTLQLYAPRVGNAFASERLTLANSRPPRPRPPRPPRPRPPRPPRPPRRSPPRPAGRCGGCSIGKNTFSFFALLFFWDSFSYHKRVNMKKSPITSCPFYLGRSKEVSVILFGTAKRHSILPL